MTRPPLLLPPSSRAITPVFLPYLLLLVLLSLLSPLHHTTAAAFPSLHAIRDFATSILPNPRTLSVGDLYFSAKLDDEDDDDDEESLLSTSPFPSLSPDPDPTEPSFTPEPSPSQNEEGEDDDDGNSDKNPGSGSNPTPSPSNTPTYPCPPGFDLIKQYKPFPVFFHICQQPSRLTPRIVDATCPQDYFLRNVDCVRNTTACIFAASTNNEEIRTKECLFRVCSQYKNAEYRFFDSHATCIICKNGYLLYMDTERGRGLGGGQYMCYKMLEETPKCPDGQMFDNDTGACAASS